MKKNLIKIGCLLGAYLFIPLSVFAIKAPFLDTPSPSFEMDNFLENDSERATQSLFNGHQKKAKSNKDRVGVLSFTASQMQAIPETGSGLTSLYFSNDENTAIVTVMEFPQIDSPEAFIGFDVPVNFNHQKRSLITIPFLTTSSLSVISGDIQFEVALTVVREDIRFSIPLRSRLLKDVKTADPANLNETPANAYNAKAFILPNTLLPGDFIGLTITRNNEIVNNLQAIIYEAGVGFAYTPSLKSLPNQ